MSPFSPNGHSQHPRQEPLKSTVTGFSLIELLVVIVILGLIASIVAPNLMGKVGGAKAKTARVQVEDLSAAMELYFLDVGHYPSTEAGLQSLIVKPPNNAQWNGPYLRKNRIPIDPWGEQYRYQAPGGFAPFEIWSLGADKKPGGEGNDADIESWR